MVLLLPLYVSSSKYFKFYLMLILIFHLQSILTSLSTDYLNIFHLIPHFDHILTSYYVLLFFLARNESGNLWTEKPILQLQNNLDIFTLN